MAKGKVTKDTLASEVAKKAGISKAKATEAINAVTGKILAETRKGNKVALQEFGTFEKRTVKAHQGFNPKTRKKISIPEQSHVGFKFSKTAKKKMK